MRKKLRLIAPLMLVVLIGSTRRVGGGECCAGCGCDQPCRQVCRLVCGEKEVEILCWGCTCEDFCVPGPSSPGCEHCTEVCGTCEQASDASAPWALTKAFLWKTWLPGDAEVFTKRKLVQKKVMKKVPSYKWVVEPLCPACAAEGERTALRAKTAADPAEAEPTTAPQLPIWK